MSPLVDGCDRGTCQTRASPQPVRREAFSSLALCFLPLAFSSSPYALYQQSLDVSCFTFHELRLRLAALGANRQSQRTQTNESFGILLAIGLVLFKRGQV